MKISEENIIVLEDATKRDITDRFNRLIQHSIDFEDEHKESADGPVLAIIVRWIGFDVSNTQDRKVNTRGTIGRRPSKELLAVSRLVEFEKRH